MRVHPHAGRSLMTMSTLLLLLDGQPYHPHCSEKTINDGVGWFRMADMHEIMTSHPQPKTMATQNLLLRLASSSLRQACLPTLSRYRVYRAESVSSNLQTGRRPLQLRSNRQWL